MLNNLNLKPSELLILFEDQVPFFLYSEKYLFNGVREIRDQFEKILINPFKMSFSMKSQPNFRIIESIKKLGLSLDVSSFAELKYALDLGFSPCSLSLGGCGLTDDGIRLAIESQIFAVHCDCLEALDYAARLKKSYDVKTLVTIRYQPENLVKTKLGFYLKELDALKSYRLDGLHVYLGRDSFEYNTFLDVLNECSNHMSNNLLFTKDPELFLGPGLPTNRSSLFLDSLNRFDFKFKLNLEMGRAIASPTGYYGAQVLSVKHIEEGQLIVIIDGGLQHLGSPWVTLKSGPTSDLPAFFDQTGKTMTLENSINAAIFGSLCLWQDCLHPRLPVPRGIKRGDWIVVPNMGAYGLTAGVPLFIGENLPREFFLSEGKLEEVTHKNFKYLGT